MGTNNEKVAEDISIRYQYGEGEMLNLSESESVTTNKIEG
jgi:hypothetical protein